MTTHRSFLAPLIDPGPLAGKVEMKPNEKCWCGSNQKWKKCHRGRDKAPAINVYDKAREAREIFAKGLCLYVDENGAACTGNAIASHTVQRSGGLASIAEEFHVLTFKPSFEDIIKHNGKPPVRRVGIRTASTFPGFCNQHDSSIFKPIEDKKRLLNKEAAILYSIRAISYELFTKSAVLRMLPLMRDVDRGKSYIQQVYIQDQLRLQAIGSEMGLKELNSQKRQLDALLHGSSSIEFHHCIVTFDTLSPIVSCGAWQPEFDFQGNKLQEMGAVIELEGMTFNLTNIGGQAVLIMGWLGPLGGPTFSFIQSLKSTQEDRCLSMVVNAAFEHSENVYMKESWWQGLKSSDRDQLLRRRFSGTQTMSRSSNALLDDDCRAVAGKATSMILE